MLQYWVILSLKKIILSPYINFLPIFLPRSSACYRRIFLATWQVRGIAGHLLILLTLRFLIKPQKNLQNKQGPDCWQSQVLERASNCKTPRAQAKL